MKTSLHSWPLSLIAAAAALLITGCGGGEGGGGQTAPEPAVVDVTTLVLDGPIAGATVCVDKNDNGACDSDETTAVTGTDGKATLAVPESDAGLYPLIAVVGTDAVDQDHGPVALPFVLRTTADQTAVISPLTTLVKAQADASTATSAEAERALRDQLGLEGSLFSDFSASTAPQAATLARLARLLALVNQQSVKANQAAEGQTDTSGGTISKDDLARAVELKLLQRLPTVAAVLAGSVVREATTAAERDAALNVAAVKLVEDPMVFDAAAVIGATRRFAAGIPESDPASPQATASLRWLSYTDADNWYFRVFESTPAQNTADADGLRRFTDQRRRAIGGKVERWGESPAFTMNNLYWTGTRWFACPTSNEHEVTPIGADGQNESRYCDAFVNRSQRVGVDIAGRPIADVIRAIRAFPLPDAEGQYPHWGPDPASPALVGKTFPAGARLWSYARAELATPETYNPSATNIVKPYVPAVADATSEGCNAVTTQNFASYQFTPTTLEQMVAGFPGKPCVYTPGSNEWWSNSTVSIGTVSGPMPASTEFSSDRSIRAAFGAGNSVTYYNCAIRAVGGSVRNCVLAGSGSYSIETRGDGRSLRLIGVPLDAAPLTTHRVFVERNGAVYFGSRNKLRSDYSQRLNTEATDALLGALGITR